MKLTARQKTIVNYFLSKDMSSDIYVSSNVLAKMFAVSYKTIQKDMNDLTLLFEHNPCGLRLITKPGLGYTIKKTNDLSEKDIQKLFGSGQNNYLLQVDAFFHRAHTIVRKVLLANRPVTQDELSNLFYISKEVIAKDLETVTKILEEFDLKINRRKRIGITIEGSESNKRICILNEIYYYKSTILYVEENEFNEMLNKYEMYIPQLEEMIITSQNQFSLIKLTQGSITKLSYLLIIFAYRQKYITDDVDEDVQFECIGRNSWQFCYLIFSQAEKILNCHYQENDKFLFTRAILGLRNYNDVKCFADKRTYFKFYRLSEQLLQQLAEKNHFVRTFSNNFMQDRLTLHLIPFVQRNAIHLKQYRPLPKMIRSSPVAVDMAVQCAYWLKKEQGITLYEDEIYFLAIIMNFYFHAYPHNQIKKKMIIVSSINSTAGYLLSLRLQDDFEKLIENITITETYQIKEENIDNNTCIFTSEPKELIQKQLSKSVEIFEVNEIYEESVKVQIYDFLSDNERKREFVANVFRQDLFFTQIECKNKEELFQIVEELLKEKVDISSNISAGLRERENILSGEVGQNQARIGCLNSYGANSFFALFLLRHPISWRYQNIQVFALWHIGSEDLEQHYWIENGFMNSMISNLLSDPVSLAGLCQNQDPENYKKMIDKTFYKVCYK